MSAFARQLFKKHNLDTYHFQFKDRNLFECLSVEARRGVGLRFSAKEWVKKGRTHDFYEITKAAIKSDLKHGKAWGILYKDGKVKEDNHRIRHGLKLSWELYSGPQPAIEKALAVSKLGEAKALAKA